MRIYPEDSELNQQWGYMAEAWLANHGYLAWAVSQDCAHDLLTNCAWWNIKMDETMKNYKRYNRYMAAPIHGDVAKGQNGYRTVDN